MKSEMATNFGGTARRATMVFKRSLKAASLLEQLLAGNVRRNEVKDGNEMRCRCACHGLYSAYRQPVRRVMRPVRAPDVACNCPSPLQGFREGRALAGVSKVAGSGLSGEGFGKGREGTLSEHWAISIRQVRIVS